MQRLPALSRDELLARMAACEVVDDNARPIAAHARRPPPRAALLTARASRRAALPAEEAVICQDEWLIVAGKPHFMPVTPSGLHK